MSLISAGVVADPKKNVSSSKPNIGVNDSGDSNSPLSHEWLLHGEGVHSFCSVLFCP